VKQSEYGFETALQLFTRGDYEEVLRTAMPHAIAGNSNAQCMISLLYQHGFGVTKDLAEAERWLLLAAKQDNAVAWNNLGTLYAIGGAGLSRGPDVANECYQRAKQLGFDCARPYPPGAAS
jgi:TPR repeat protein